MKKKSLDKRVWIFGGVILIVLLIGGFVFFSGSDSERVLIKTNMGDIVVELDSTAAPITVDNFLKYVDEGFYDGLVFHRVIKGFMIQGGGFYPDGVQKKTFDPIKLESDNGLSNKKYTIAMARTSVPDSATSQFFINVADNVFLDYSGASAGYAVFGRVVSGEDVVDAISLTETETKYQFMADWPVEDVVIESVRRV